MTPQQFRKKSGKLMKQARIAAGYSLEEAAKLLQRRDGITSNTWWIENLESGILRYPNFKELVSLARLYNVSVEYFIPLDKPLPEIKKPATKYEAQRKAVLYGIEKEFVRLAKKHQQQDTEYMFSGSRSSAQRIHKKQVENLERRKKK